MTQDKTKPTAGALRAAQLIVATINAALVARDHTEVLEPQTVVPELAAIIDYASAAPELYAALKELWMCHEGGGYVQPDAVVLTRVYDALALAEKGEQ